MALTKKQAAALEKLDQPTLVQIVNELIFENKVATNMVVNTYLSSADDILKLVEKAYIKEQKSTRFHDYHESAAYFDGLYKSQIKPLEKIIDQVPEKLEILVQKMIFGFGRIVENADGSDGSWGDYFFPLLSVWVKSLMAQKVLSPQAVAEKILYVYEKDGYIIGQHFFSEHRLVLGHPVLRIIRDYFDLQKKKILAVNISLMIRDCAYLGQQYAGGTFPSAAHQIEYAKLLIDDFQADKALEVLLSMNSTSSDRSGNWFEVLILAMIEEGQTEAARAKCVEAFGLTHETRFYQLFSKIKAPSEIEIEQFTATAKAAGVGEYFDFLIELEHYHVIDAYIEEIYEEKIIVKVLSEFIGSALRQLSNDLFKRGYPVSATLIRRFLVEDEIKPAQSRYYRYAAADMKKAIDFSLAIEDKSRIASTEVYFEALYQLHKRKSSLWFEMEEKISGLEVTQSGLRYQP